MLASASINPPEPSLITSFIISYGNEISLVGTVATIIGLILSSYIFFTARRINQYIFFSRRLPQLQKKIGNHASLISKSLNDFDNSYDEIREEMARCSANLKSLRRRVPRLQRKTINSVLNIIASILSKSDLTKESTRDVYIKLLYISEDMQNIQIDYQMEK